MKKNNNCIYAVRNRNLINFLTVFSKLQNGNEKCDAESLVYNNVSFSTPNIIASSNRIPSG